MVSGHLQIKKGYYYVVLSYYDNRNKRHVKYVSTGLPEKGNKRKAEAALARVRSEFEPPQEVGELASDMPFAEYLLEWLDIVKVRVKATTYSSYEAMVKSTLEPYFRKKGYTLQGLEARHIQQFYTEKLKTVKPSSVIHYHAVIHQALKYAMKTDLVTQNVAMKVDRPKRNDYQPVFLDAEELQRLFQVVKGTRLELPVLVAAFYGLRRGEVCGLKWDAIDFERGTITIKHTVTSIQVDGKTKMYAQDSAKTKSSMRTLPLVGSFAEYFREVKAAQELKQAGLRQLLQLRVRRVCLCGRAGRSDEAGLSDGVFSPVYPKARLKAHAFPRFETQLRFAVAGKRRAPQADSGLAGTQRFFYHGEYLRPSGLQLQAVLSAGDGERNAPAGNGGFRQQMG